MVCGVICEYNPFHNGHAYHLRALRERTGCTWIVCVMSGAFTQRGHPAILSKWARAEMALRGGADAVFELPTLFAVRDAEHFARGGVALLLSLGVVTHLGFGSETEDLSSLHLRAKVEGDLSAIRHGLAQGMSLARARGEALGISSGAPNDILAVEYLRALRGRLEPVAIRREGHGYHDLALGAMASASAIRAALRRGEDVYASMPPSAYALLGRMLDAGAYQQEGGLDTVLLAMLRSSRPEVLAQVLDVGEGLENRILRAAMESTTRDELIERIKCKRYTWARISRICTQALLGITKKMAASYPSPTYARLLGFRSSAQPLMAQIKKSATIPVVTRAAKHRYAGDASLDLDMHAGDLWTLGLQDPRHRTGANDLMQNIIIVQ